MHLPFLVPNLLERLDLWRVERMLIQPPGAYDGGSCDFMEYYGRPHAMGYPYAPCSCTELYM